MIFISTKKNQLLLVDLIINAALVRRFYFLERVMGIEPTLFAWEAKVLPLNYTRIYHYYAPIFYICPDIYFQVPPRGAEYISPYFSFVRINTPALRPYPPETTQSARTAISPLHR